MKKFWKIMREIGRKVEKNNKLVSMIIISSYFIPLIGTGPATTAFFISRRIRNKKAENKEDSGTTDSPFSFSQNLC